MTPGAVVAISSHVMRGSVGNRAIVFALESLGLPVWAVNTVSLPFHPGHGRSTRIEPEPERFAAQLDELLASPWTGEIGAVVTGYMASAAQVELVAGFIAGLRRRHPGITYLCDPVIGDGGGLYVAPQTAAAIRDHLLPMAEIAAPNVHELAWLVGTGALREISEIVAAARRLGPSEIVVTSTPAGSEIGNLLVTRDEAILCAHTRVNGPPNGPGDLFSALYLGRRILGETPVDALRLATAGVFAAIGRAARKESGELTLAADRDCLVDPKVDVRMFEPEAWRA